LRFYGCAVKKNDFVHFCSLKTAQLWWKEVLEKQYPLIAAL